ncbi:MAG: dephospho-CoA kinase [Muribaculaceae bacterium]|nr:dephospho-CoA kinase [Muribaculaceae bacterium]
MKLIIITGGIGSGKSVVSRLVGVMGYPTYDCDSEAKRLMNESPILKAQLRELLGHETYDDKGKLNRSYVASRIFSDKNLLQQMNAIVHPAVREDLKNWLAESAAPIAFAETALLEESGLGEEAQRIWVVDAPMELRIERVMQRSALNREQVSARIASQAAQFNFPDAVHILNDNVNSLIEQITALLNESNKM